MVGDYALGKVIGEGSFGVVRLGTHLYTPGLKAAIKIIAKKDHWSRDAKLRITREIDILTKVKHPNLIECYDVIETADHWYFIMEYASGGDLFDYIVSR